MARVLRWSLLVAVTATLMGAGLPAQQRFRTTTALLTLDVSVLDQDGNPVTGLTPDDFTVSLNGETKAVKAMTFLATQGTGATEAIGHAASGFATASTPAVSAGEPDPRLFVLMLDDMSIYPTESKGLFVAAERFVDTIPSRDWVGLTTTSGLVTVNPSLDRAPLVRRLRRTFGWMNDPRREAKPYIGLMEALLIDNGSEATLREAVGRECGIPPNALLSKNFGQILAENPCAHDVERQARSSAAFARANARNQLDAYRAVIRAMAPAPGVKQLVILTGGMAVRPADSTDFIDVAKAASAAGVQITMLMEEPDPAEPTVPHGREFATDQIALLQQGQTLTDMSGGQFFRVVGQADRFYQRVLTSAAAVYRIGVDLPASVPRDGDYKVTVAVRRPGVRVLASRYAAPPSAPAASTPADQMARAIKTGELSYVVPIQMTADVVEAANGRALRVIVDVSGSTRGPVPGRFALIGPDRKLKSGRQDLVRSADGHVYRLDFLVPAAAAGTYELRFAVADASGAVGSIAQKVVVK